MVAVPAGPFWMGCNEDLDVECNPDEYPYHEVTLSAYAIDRTEVTAEAYASCVSEGACTESDCPDGSVGMQPVNCVTWFQAQEFCQWLGKDLPTEAQWEKAARGDDGRLYPWGNQAPTCTLAAMGNCGNGQDLQPVGLHPAGASPYGALDMAGSLMEWTADWYSPSYYIESPGTDPLGPDTGTRRTIRSATLINLAPDMRNSLRFPVLFSLIYPDEAPGVVGFRCALNP